MEEGMLERVWDDMRGQGGEAIGKRWDRGETKLFEKRDMEKG